MTRALAVVCLAFIGGVASAGERFVVCLQTDRAEHEVSRAADPDESLTRLKATLAEIIELQKRLRDEFSNDFHKHRPHAPQQLRIASVPIVMIEKGGYATITHAISWGQYPNDELDVKVTASDASIVVPEKLSLDFEKHQFRFAYEIKAGQKSGEFTVTLIPAPGQPVEVKVIVK